MAKETKLPPIDGIEQLDAIPPGARAVSAECYSDEADLLTRLAQSKKPRSRFVIVPCCGWPKRLYRKATK